MMIIFNTTTLKRQKMLAPAVPETKKKNTGKELFFKGVRGNKGLTVCMCVCRHGRNTGFLPGVYISPAGKTKIIGGPSTSHPFCGFFFFFPVF